jgi:hypothetical protein
MQKIIWKGINRCLYLSETNIEAEIAVLRNQEPGDSRSISNVAKKAKLSLRLTN